MVLRNIYNFISKNTIIFVAFMLLVVLSVCSLLFTLNFILNVVKNNEQTLDDAGMEYGARYFGEGATISVFILIGVFNLVYVYTYILDTRKKELSINRISGQTILSAVAISYFEIFILSTVGYIISVLIMKLAIFPIISERGFMFADSINTLMLFLIYLAFVLIYSLVFLPSIIRQIRKSPIEALIDE